MSSSNSSSAHAGSDNASNRPFRPNRPSSSGTLLDESVSTDASDLSRSMADRLAIQSGKPSATDRRTCSYGRCEDRFGHDEGHNDDGESFCSTECWSRRKAVKLLRGIKYDHRLCNNCFTILKEIEPPPFDAPECAIGRQFYFPDRTARALGDVSFTRPLLADEWAGDATDADAKGPFVRVLLESRDETTQCTCRACHHSTRDWPDRFSLREWTRDLLPALCEALSLRESGRHDSTDYSRDALFDKVCEWHDAPQFQGNDGSRKLLEAALGWAIRYSHYSSD